MSIPVVLFSASWFLIFYSYVLFPVLLFLCARWFAARSTGKETSLSERDSEEALPRVAMIVAAYNEAGVLGDKLKNTWAIDYPADRLRLVVGSDGSADATGDILRRCADTRLDAHVFTERRGKISVLNDLVGRTDADILVMSDANTMYAPDAVRKMVRHFHDTRVGCVSGELGLEQNGGVSGEGLYWKYEGWIKRNESKLGFLIGCNGGIFALRRSLYEPLPPSTIVEDFVLSMRVLERGHQVRFEPDARATEPPCPTSRAEMIRKIRIGAGNFQALAFTYPLLFPHYGLRSFAFWGHKVLRWLVPLFLLTALVSNVALWQVGLYQVLLALQLGGVLIAAWSYQAQAGQRGLPRWTRPISYFYLMNYALLCGFFRFLFRTQRVTWERASR